MNNTQKIDHHEATKTGKAQIEQTPIENDYEDEND